MVKNRFLRFLLIIAGFISLGLGIIGRITPIQPSPKDINPAIINKNLKNLFLTIFLFPLTFY